jgi:hypothetical protein
MIKANDICWTDDELLGEQVECSIPTYFDAVLGIGTLVQIKDGSYKIKVRLYCDHAGCHKFRTFYLGPGPAGPDHYVYNIYGKFLADLLEESWACPKHRSTVSE